MASILHMTLLNKKSKRGNDFGVKNQEINSLGLVITNRIEEDAKLQDKYKKVSAQMAVAGLFRLTCVDTFIQMR